MGIVTEFDKQNLSEVREWLKGLLHEGVVDVTFKKTSGEERVMKCTLQETDGMDYEKKTDRVKKENDDTLAVFDVEKNGWRSFRLDSITRIEFTIGNGN